MIIQGLRFGMMLQFAIGPVCIFIFQAASAAGFYPAETGVLGVVLVDGLYILASIVGLGALIARYPGMKTALKIFGAIVLIVFGASTLLNTLGISFLPSLQFSSSAAPGGMFWRTALLTLSNPLTIIFWAGVFSSRIAKGSMSRSDMYSFGAGAVLSTLLFLTLIALLGSLSGAFLPEAAIKLLNIVVGLLLIAFGLKTALNKTEMLSPTAG